MGKNKGCGRDCKTLGGKGSRRRGGLIHSFTHSFFLQAVLRIRNCCFNWLRWSLADWIFSLNSSLYFSAFCERPKNSRLLRQTAMSFSTLVIFLRMANSFWNNFLSALGSLLSPSI